MYSVDQLSAVSLAIANFSQNNTDTKAMMLPTYNSAVGIVRQMSKTLYSPSLRHYSAACSVSHRLLRRAITT